MSYKKNYFSNSYQLSRVLVKIISNLSLEEFISSFFLKKFSKSLEINFFLTNNIVGGESN